MPSDKVTRTRKNHIVQWRSVRELNGTQFTFYIRVQQDSSEFLNNFLMVIGVISKAQIVTFSMLVQRELDLFI